MMQLRSPFEFVVVMVVMWVNVIGLFVVRAVAAGEVWITEKGPDDHKTERSLTDSSQIRIQFSPQSTNVTMFPAPANGLRSPMNWFSVAADGTGLNVAALGCAYDDPYNSLGYCMVKLYYSRNFGATWSTASISPARTYSSDGESFVLSDSEGCKLFVSMYDHYNFGTMDCGNSWWQASTYSYLSYVAGGSTNQYMLGVYQSSLVVSRNYGYTWTAVEGTQPYAETTAVAGNGTFFAAVGCYNTHYAYVQMSHNLTSWKFKIMDLGWLTYCGSGAFISSSESGQILLIAAGSVVLKLDNFGESWSFLTHVPTPYPYYAWTSIRCDSRCERILLTGRTSNEKSDTIFLSSDSGNSWERIPFRGNYSSDVNIYATSMSLDGSFITAATSGYLAQDEHFVGNVFTNCNPSLLKNETFTAFQPEYEYMFSELGYMCGTSFINLKLRAPCIASVGHAAYVTIQLVATVNSIDDNLLFEGDCMLGAANFSVCAVNVELNSSSVSSSNGGSFSLLVKVDLSAAAACQTTEYYYKAEIALSVQPVYIAPVVVTREFNFDVYSVLAVCLVTSLFAILGVLLTLKSKPSSKWIVSTQVGHMISLGFLFSTEIWLYCVINYGDCEVSSFRLLSEIYLILRLLALGPGMIILFKLFAPPGISGTQFYQDNMNWDHLKQNILLTWLLSLMLLLDPRVIVYFPWRSDQCRDSSVKEDGITDTSLKQNNSELAPDKPVPAFAEERHGYPDVVIMDLCTMFCGITMSVSLLSQIIVLSIYYQTAEAGEFRNWIGPNLVLRVLLALYLLVYLLYSLPTFILLYGHLVESWSFTNVTSSFCSFPSLRSTWNYANSYEPRLRLSRLRKLPCAALRLCWAFTKLVLAVGLYLSVGLRCCPDATCWIVFPSVMFIVVTLYFVMLVIEIYVTLEYDDDYDPHLEILLIAASYSLNAEKITRLLKATPVTLAICRFGSLYLLLSFMNDMIAPLSHGYVTYQFNGKELKGVQALIFMEFAYPTIAWGLHRHHSSGGNICECLRGLCRLDVYLVNMFLMFMIVFVCPLSILSNVSIMKANNWTTSTSLEHRDEAETSQEAEPNKTQPKNNLLSFQLRDHWDEIDSELRVVGIVGSSRWKALRRTIFTLIDRLSKRFTVVYSFVKLCGTIAFTLFVNRNYLECGSMGRYHDKVFCDVSYSWAPGPTAPIYYHVYNSHPCQASCLAWAYPPVITYPPTDGMGPPPPPTPWQCSVEISGECICNNWFMFQFTVIVLHVIHYVVQCYYYIRYNYFDPQQNQINCVETYSFAGNNLTLFLTQPSMCFLSMIEAICIVIVWTEVSFAPGAHCEDSYYSVGSSFSLYFAVFITVIEIYKANLSTCGKLATRREYWWALWSLIRMDLFIFYGFTLFLQSFFFPFSCIGYFFSGYSKLKTEDADDDTLDTSLLVAASAEYCMDSSGPTYDRSDQGNSATVAAE
jgi:hypothetical protein